MDVSVRSFALVIMLVGAAGCVQSSPGDVTSPSSLVGGASGTQAGPGASYDATGLWQFVITDIHGEVDEIFDANVSQDGEGNLSFVDDDGNLITLTRLGTGVVITYRLELTGDDTPCDFRFKGTARLDTRTNTMTVNVAFRDNECSHGVFIVTATKAS
jgi:hypothetical protein